MTALEAITQIVNERRKQGIYPASASLTGSILLSGLDVSEFRKQLLQLKRDGVVTLYQTINSHNILLNDTDNKGKDTKQV